MPVCPYCGAEIDYLLYREVFSYASIYYYAELDGEDLKLGERHFEDGELDDHWYECPECGERLFSSDWEAEAFLKGDLEAQLRALGQAEE